MNITPSSMNSAYLQSNRELWDLWTRLNLEQGSEYLDLLEKLRDGWITLQPIELEELPDVAGKSFLHLQCHFGLDTLSWARQGAEVTGVDFSPESIRLAQVISQELGIRATFICANLYDLPQMLDQRFEIVFTSHGVLPWLPDLGRWAEIIFLALKPGGIFYIVDGHPARRLLLPSRRDATGNPIEYGYFPRSEPVRVEEPGSYANSKTDFVHSAFYWPHNLAEIITSLCSAGLRIEFLHEFPQRVDVMQYYEETEPGTFARRLRSQVDVPLTFSLKAKKDEK